MKIGKVAIVLCSDGSSGGVRCCSVCLEGCRGRISKRGERGGGDEEGARYGTYYNVSVSQDPAYLIYTLDTVALVI